MGQNYFLIEWINHMRAFSFKLLKTALGRTGGSLFESCWTWGRTCSMSSPFPIRILTSKRRRMNFSCNSWLIEWKWSTRSKITRNFGKSAFAGFWAETCLTGAQKLSRTFSTGRMMDSCNFQQLLVWNSLPSLSSMRYWIFRKNSSEALARRPFWRDLRQIKGVQKRVRFLRQFWRRCYFGSAPVCPPIAPREHSGTVVVQGVGDFLQSTMSVNFAINEECNSFTSNWRHASF